MTISFMRWVDKWIGVPFCFLLSLFHLAYRRFSEEKPKPPINKILFIQLSEMGSSIAAYSSLVKAKEMFPDAQLYYLIFEEMQESIRLLDIIPDENILTISSRDFPSLIRDVLRVFSLGKKIQFDATIDLELFSRVSTILSFLLCRGTRIGFSKFHMEGLYRGSLQTHNAVYNHTTHISFNYLSLVYCLCEPWGTEPMSKRVADESDRLVPQTVSTDEQKHRILEKLQRSNQEISAASTIILLNPNGSPLLPLRRWPIESYIALTKKLLADPDVFVVITGTASERAEADIVCARIQSRRCVNFAGQTSLRELIDLYNVSSLLLSNDSGPPHFASLTKIKTLVFFGPETPTCYAPLGDNIHVLYSNFLCSPCVSAYNHRNSACTDNKCLQSISANEVLQKIKEQLPSLKMMTASE